MNEAETLIEQREKIAQEAKTLSDIKNSLYGRMDISSPMSAHEKELTQKIANLWSEVNDINRKLRAFK